MSRDSGEYLTDLFRGNSQKTFGQSSLFRMF